MMGWRDTITPGQDTASAGSWRDTIRPAEAGDGLDNPVSTFVDQAARSPLVVGPLAVKAGHALAAGLGSITPDSMLKPQQQGKSFSDLYGQLEQQDQTAQQQRWDRHPLATGLGTALGAATTPVPGLQVGAGASTLQRLGGAMINAGLGGEAIRADALARGQSDKDAAKTGTMGSLAGLAGSAVGKMAGSLTSGSLAAKSAALAESEPGVGGYIASAGLGAGLGSAIGGPAGGMAGAAAGLAGRRYGTNAAAAGLDALSEMMKAPESLGRYAGPLLAAADRGGNALAVTHYLLSQKDPAYQGLFQEFQGTKDFKSKANAFLADNVSQPLADAGYPNLGAGLATVPSVAMDAAMPSAPADYLPLGAVVHLGKYPFGKLLSDEEATALRESLTKIGGINGNPAIAALKVDNAAHHLPADTEMWQIRDFSQSPEAPKWAGTKNVSWADKAGGPPTTGEAPAWVGNVTIKWVDGTPVLESIQNLSKETTGKHMPGLIADFLDKYTERVGEISSSMNFAPTATADGKRYLGKEMWQDSLPRVVKAPAPEGHMYVDPGKNLYRILSRERFAEWLANNPKALEKMLAEDPNAGHVVGDLMDKETYAKWLEQNPAIAKKLLKAE